MIPINEMLVPVGTKRRKGTKLKGNNGVVIHEAGTPNAPAKNHALNQHNNPNKVVNGWHLTVDDKEAWLSIPLDEVAEHCGKRNGNDTTVAIEIADKVTSGDYWHNAVDNAAQLAAHVLKLKGFSRAVWKENIWQHNDWNGKDCPYQIRRGNPMSFTDFVALVNQYMGAEESAPQPAPEPEKSIPALTRNLKLTSPMMRGDDVRQAQERLEHHLAQPGKIDGIYGKNTKAATIRFQKARIAEGYDLGSAGADGVIGPKTWKILC